MIAVGLIGFGLAGTAFHAPIISSVERLRLAKIVTSRAEEANRICPEAVVVGDAAAVLDDPEIELVIVATPNDSHAPLARAALEAGKHVVVDKPFVLDPAEGEALIALARQRGRLLTVFHNRRWDGDFLTVRDILRSGRLGEVRLAELRWDRYRPAIKQGWRELPGEGGGALADLGPHLIDQALLLFGEPDGVTADLATQRGEALVDDYFELILRYGPSRVILSASTLVAAPRPRFALHGTAASFVKPGVDGQASPVRTGGPREDPPELFGELKTADGGSERIPTLPSAWPQFYKGVADAILHGAPAPVDPADALAGLRIIAAARRDASLRAASGPAAGS